jgi:hypothetical protein
MEVFFVIAIILLWVVHEVNKLDNPESSNKNGDIKIFKTYSFIIFFPFNLWIKSINERADALIKEKPILEKEIEIYRINILTYFPFAKFIVHIGWLISIFIFVFSLYDTTDPNALSIGWVLILCGLMLIATYAVAWFWIITRGFLIF